MAVSAFKSASRRGNTSSVSSKASSGKETGGMALKKTTKVPEPPRRSRSVSAFARNQTQSDVSFDFLTTRDNPLFWDNQSNQTDAQTQALTRNISAADSNQSNQTDAQTQALTRNISAADSNRRGRSVSRNPLGGRSVSVSREDAVPAGRRFRSVSRQPVSRSNLNNSEVEMEQQNRLSPTCSVTSNGSILDRIKSGRADNCTTASRNLVEEDRHSMGSFSEAEEKTIRPVCEQMHLQVDNLGGDASASSIYKTVCSEVRRAISDIQNDLRDATQRSNGTVLATTNITDIPPDLVSPSAVELVLDIRSEYAKKLEQSQERARKLRAELAVEERRELELSRILKEVLPHPKISNLQKPRPQRKSSIERRKVSKKLNEEAMAYFDECVSLSTFDSSDFSSQEDPSQNFVQVGDNMPLPHSSSSISTAGCSGPCLHDNQDSRVTYNSNALEFDASSSTKRPTQAAAILDCKNVEHGGKYRFSFSRKSTEALEVQEDIRKYVRSFGKEREQLDDNAPIGRSKPIDLEKYDEQSKVQSLLFDCVAFKNRLESGSLLLCGGRIANTSSLFASMI